VQVLSGREHIQARIAARKRFTSLQLSDKDAESATMQDLLGDLIAQELLAMSLVSVEPIPGRPDSLAPIYARLFRDGKDIDDMMTDELAVLFNHYVNAQHKYGPTEKSIESDEELSQWIKVLAEGAESDPLARFALPQLVACTYLLAERAYSLSQILESQFSTLPDTLASSLKAWGIGTGFFGAQPEKPTDTSSEKSPEPAEPITMAQALDKAKKLRTKA